jgi:hypothetical protein
VSHCVPNWVLANQDRVSVGDVVALTDPAAVGRIVGVVDLVDLPVIDVIEGARLGRQIVVRPTQMCAKICDGQ